MLKFNERQELKSIYKSVRKLTWSLISSDEISAIKQLYRSAHENGILFERNEFDIHPLLEGARTILALCRLICPDRVMTLTIMLYRLYKSDAITLDYINRNYGEDVARLVEGTQKVSTLYGSRTAIADENYSKLLMTFAQDIRVIIIMIIDRLVLMRAINHHPAETLVKNLALESALLYAPIAHRLGLYKIKGELEDLSLKYTNREIFTRIADKLKETKTNRERYISEFIKPVKAALEKEGLKFDIKGRTKSIYSIWNKMRKQHNDVENIYDLFAIRIILNSDTERERRECWTAYSIVADMFQPNPARFKDWLTIPKSNGYESLHTTVAGPEGKWVEVQIRSRRMDEIAEKGVAAHWKYKGIKSESNLDTWMNRVREILETADQTRLERMKNLDLDIYSKEIFVFTPKGDLYKLPLGATVLDFAFNIHSNLGCTCVGGKVNGKSKKINHKLSNGDTVEILSASNQKPKLDWLNFVVTSKARTKIRQTLKEQDNKTADYARELLQRRFKNRKIDVDEGRLSKLIKKLGYKSMIEFYTAIADETLDINDVITRYEQETDETNKINEPVTSAEEFVLTQPQDAVSNQNDDVLIIGENVKGLNYKLAKCCNPIYGDDVFGFISSEGVIKIHSVNCPNAKNIRERYPYRIIPTKWSGKQGVEVSTVIKIVGIDDIGIVTNISSIINKEPDVALRRIDIQSHDGVFNGILVLGVKDTAALTSVIKKISTVKGVKNVTR